MKAVIKKYVSPFAVLFLSLWVSSFGFAKDRIGIIGGGSAGLAAAWLLESNFDVTLFEKNSWLGGHADTYGIDVNGQSIPVDGGAEFFTDQESPHFNRLLQLLKVPVHRLPLTYTFHRTDRNSTLVMTPFQEGHLKWRSLSPSHLAVLLQFKYTVQKGKTFAATENTEMTLEEFVDTLNISTSFRDEVLYPFYASGWGVSQAEVKKFSAYDVLKTTTQNTSLFNLFPPLFNEVEGGMSAYIHAEAAQLGNTQIKLSSVISKVSYDGTSYTVLEANGTQSTFEHLILATNAKQAEVLINSIPGTDSVRSVLRTVEYYTTTVAIHGDPSFMPMRRSDWSVVNVRYDGTDSAMTTYNSWRSPAPLFKSWIVNDKKLPSPLYQLVHYEHPKIDRNYERAQKAILEFQGQNNLWFAGVYTNGVNCHESALISAVRIAQKLAPQSTRLNDLLGIVDQTYSHAPAIGMKAPVR